MEISILMFRICFKTKMNDIDYIYVVITLYYIIIYDYINMSISYYYNL